ncbi:MAG TPA: hypothetical protein VFZ52_22865 [Chryseolinea sp.]
MKHYKFLLLTLMALATSAGFAQKQLVLLSREKVMLRLNPGDEFVISLKGDKRKMTSYINNLFDTAVMVHKTIIPFHKIDKIYFKHSAFINRFGKFLVVGGVAYFVIDQFNTVVVQGDEASLDDAVTKVSVGMVAVGLPMMLIKKRYLRLGGKYRVLVVEEGSPFYEAPRYPIGEEP